MSGDASGSTAYDLSGDFRGATINIESQVHVDLPRLLPYTPPPPPDPDGPLPDPGPLPPTSHMLYGRNPLFTGREEALRALAVETFRPNVSTPVIISSGIGGVGKTQLAVEFAHRYGRFFHSVHWVSLAEAEGAPTAMVECGRRMGLHPAFGGLTLDDQVALTQAAWEGPEQRLLIFDNCEDPALLERWRPKSGETRLLVTSRRQGRWPKTMRVTEQSLDTLPLDEAVALLERYTAPSPTLAEIVAELGGLALALTMAGSYLATYANDPTVTPKTLLAELRDPALALRSEALTGRGVEASPTGHELHVANTFLLSLRRLEQIASRGALAVKVLARAACFAPGEPLPLSLLRAAAVREAPDAKPGLGQRIKAWLRPTPTPTSTKPTSRDVTDALNALYAVGLLEPVGDETVRLHRLIARFVAEALSASENGEGSTEAREGMMVTARAAVEGATNSLAYQQNMTGDPGPLHAWVLHLRYVTDAAFDHEDKTAATLCTNLGYHLKLVGDLPGTRRYYERALAISERILGPNHPDTATSLNNIGSLLLAQGDLAGARPYLERALIIRRRFLGPDHPYTAQSLNNLGMLLQDQGDLAGARPYFERALAVRARVLGPNHPETATTLNNLGMLLQAQGDLAGARPYFERALTVRERTLGPDHPQATAAANNLGSLLKAQGDLTRARLHLERALTVSERVLGPDHPQTATAANNLGLLLLDLGDLAGARLHFERALVVSERVLGPEHPDTARSLNSLGGLLQAQGDLVGARSYFELTLAILETRLGPDHPGTRTARSDLAGLEKQLRGEP
ncbi:tetratricopeptide repeat protein [Promineifilum sp.]|uniref:tetratricopeptide repeat protein n=1 Tax=Promineifilum sp. TaxID=2664178 RepID=UPI0035ADC355